MAFPRLYLLRHGQTEWNVEGRFQGQKNSPLTARGKEDAAAQGRLLAPVLAQHPKIDIFASPLGRVRQTADIALRDHNRPPHFHDSLMEIHIGNWQGLSLREIESGWPDIFNAHATTFDLLAMFPTGESAEALFARCTTFLHGLTGPSVLFSHGAVMAALRTIARDLPPREAAHLDHRQGCIYRIQNRQEKIFDEPLAQSPAIL
jgi:probable phosphoglycerate mutase